MIEFASRVVLDGQDGFVDYSNVYNGSTVRYFAEESRLADGGFFRQGSDFLPGFRSSILSAVVARLHLSSWNVENGVESLPLLTPVCSLAKLLLELAELVESDANVVLLFVEDFLDFGAVHQSQSPIGDEHWRNVDDGIVLIGGEFLLLQRPECFVALRRRRRVLVARGQSVCDELLLVQVVERRCRAGRQRQEEEGERHHLTGGRVAYKERKKHGRIRTESCAAKPSSKPHYVEEFP